MLVFENFFDVIFHRMKYVVPFGLIFVPCVSILGYLGKSHVFHTQHSHTIVAATKM